MHGQRPHHAEEDDARADVLVRLVVLLSQRRLGRAVSDEGRAVALGDGPSTALASRSSGRYARLPDWLPTQDFGPSAQHGRREHAGDDAGRRYQRWVYSRRGVFAPPIFASQRLCAAAVCVVGCVVGRVVVCCWFCRWL